MGRKKEHELKEYTKEEIEKIIRNADASKLDPNELDTFLDLLLIQTIDTKVGDNKFTSEASEFVMVYIRDFVEFASKKVDAEQYKIYLEKVNDYLNLSSIIIKLDDEQGINVGDYDRNVWRATYILKSVRMAEWQKAQGLPVEEEEYLLENQTKNKLKNFDDTIERITFNYMQTQAVGNLAFFLADYTGLFDFQFLAMRFALDLDLREILAKESECVEEIILKDFKDKYIGQSDTEDSRIEFNKELNKIISKYRPLLTIPRLEDIKVPETAYDKVRDNYIGLPLKEIVKKYKNIKGDLYKEVLRGYYKDDE